MVVELTQEQVAELRTLLESTLSDLSYEIAATDGHAFRIALLQRRERLNQILALMAEEPETVSAVVGPSVELYEELQHPGD